MFRTFVWLAGMAAGVLGLAGPALAQGYQIRPGDTLQVEVIEDPGLNREVLVAPDGRITLPLAGSVQAAGRTVEQVRADLAARLAPNFPEAPSVFVGVGELAERVPVEPRTIDIYVLGEVAAPGRIEVEPGTTLLQAIAEMGGFSRFAATERMQLRRTDRRSGQEFVYRIDFEAIAQGRSNAGTVTLTDGDVIVVPQRGLFE